MRCARNPPPCHCLAYFAAQHSCLQHFFEDMLSRSAENKSAKSKQFAVGFSRLWEVWIMIFGHFGSTGAHFGDPGANFEDFWDCCDFGSVSATKKYLHFEVKMQPLTHFVQCCFFDVFLSAHFSCFLWFWVPRGSILKSFWLPFGSPGPLKKQCRMCHCHQF